MDAALWGEHYLRGLLDGDGHYPTWAMSGAGASDALLALSAASRLSSDFSRPISSACCAIILASSTTEVSVLDEVAFAFLFF